MLHIVSDKAVSDISVISVQGQQLVHVPIEGTHQSNVALPGLNGVYIVNVKLMTGETKNFKIIVK
jgi:hypothetical protein